MQQCFLKANNKQLLRNYNKIWEKVEKLLNLFKVMMIMMMINT